MKKLLFLALVLTSPGVWQVFLHFPLAVSEWSHWPANSQSSVRSKLSTNYFTYISELRWGGRSNHRDNLFSRFIYNKQLFLINESFELIQNATPKLYFLAGDGSQFSPSRIEPISTVLFPFWIIGLIYLIKDSKYKVFLLFTVCLFLGYISGRKNLAILFPALIMQIYICFYGLTKTTSRKIVVVPILLYGVYITLMNLWLNGL